MTDHFNIFLKIYLTKFNKMTNLMCFVALKKYINNK